VKQQRTQPAISQPLPTGGALDLSAHPQRWIGIKELAQLLGVSPRTLYEGSKEAAELKACAVTFGKHLRWQLSFVLEWMEARQQAAIEAARARREAAINQQEKGKVVRFKQRGQQKLNAEEAAMLERIEQRRAALRRTGRTPA
jgi:predicted DNA-binding transcriptional regulator AlpA